MKRILVVDESQAVRETLAVILGGEFAVLQRPSMPPDGLSHPDETVDLLILGAPAGRWTESSILVKITSRLSCPVLFLVDSRSTLEPITDLAAVDFLSKPFNPYELKEKVNRLLASPVLSSGPEIPLFLEQSKFSRYLDYPYLPPPTSALAKRYAATTVPILVMGERGCGQERVARALYSLNDRAGPWVSVHAPETYLFEQLAELSRRERPMSPRVTLFVGNVETLDRSAQSSLLDFLEEEEERGGRYWILSSSAVDLLEKVYRGEFLHSLYYRLATLVLRLLPLRERRQDLPSLAAWFAEKYGSRLGLKKVVVSSQAAERLCNYLWFGNLDEMETVIARSVATHRKSVLEARDLMLGDSDEGQSLLPPILEAKQDIEARVTREVEGQVPDVPAPAERENSESDGLGNGHSSEMRLLITELAHELKNPMVTIKTFAQLLGERFDDPTFRVHFKETVSSDIERMDELLEALIDFSRFAHPSEEKIVLYEHLRQVLEELVPECTKKETRVRWGRTDERGAVVADQSQLRCAFKNLLRTVLSEIKTRGEIQIDVEGEGKVAVSYVRHESGISPFTHYLDLSSSTADEEAPPLRFLLAKILFQRNGAAIKVDRFDGGRVLIRTELPVR